MIDAGMHLEFIAWAYAGVAVLTLGVIGFVIWESRAIKARLEQLEKAGIRRRSETPT